MITIGIAGGTGSGKTTIVSNILQQLGNSQVNVLTQDNYYHHNPSLTMEQRIHINYDHPDSIDFELLLKDIQKLKSGFAIDEPVYSFVSHSRTEKTTRIVPKDILIIEGILVLANPKLREELDIKVFVDADADERLMRRVRRDIEERGRDLDEVFQRYQTTLKPMHEKFIEPSKIYADIIIPAMKKNAVAVNILSSFIQNSLK